jgi:competence protein ComFB
MNIHNVVEDMVIEEVNKICDDIEKEGTDTDAICTCEQCRKDAACYVLNRVSPHYILSGRGLVRAEKLTVEKQQRSADIAVLSYDALKLVRKNQRDGHHRMSGRNVAAESVKSADFSAVFMLPAIVGRIFDGVNFEPLSDIDAELYENGTPAAMVDHNWQNPFRLVPKTEGVYTFCPAPFPAARTGEHRTFTFTVKASAPSYETLRHYFEIPVVSEPFSKKSSPLDSTYKINDLYMFPPDNSDD